MVLRSVWVTKRENPAKICYELCRKVLLNTQAGRDIGYDCSGYEDIFRPTARGGRKSLDDLLSIR